MNCYGKFIEMGVDGFRIDTTGHISRLTFNKQFIPQFLAIAETHKAKRVGSLLFADSHRTYRSVVSLGKHLCAPPFGIAVEFIEEILGRFPGVEIAREIGLVAVYTNDGTRFNGGTAQWAENLSLMFTFRGIPCIYYGSEVEFKKGKPIDVGGENNKTPRKDSGRAYFRCRSCR